MKIKLVLLFIPLLLSACQTNLLEIEREAMQATMEKHLNAVATRNIEDLSATLSTDDDMILILPQTEITYTTKEFIDYHIEWFEDTSWTFDSKIISLKAGTYFGMAVVEVMYREPNLNGKPYFNRMNVSYVLEKKAGRWCVIKDHASSIEKGDGKQ